MDKFISLVAIFQNASPILLFVAILMHFGVRGVESRVADKQGSGHDVDMINQTEIMEIRKFRNGFLWAAAILGSIVALVNIYIASIA